MEGVGSYFILPSEELRRLLVQISVGKEDHAASLFSSYQHKSADEPSANVRSWPTVKLNVKDSLALQKVQCISLHLRNEAPRRSR